MPNNPHITKLEEAVAFNERTIEELSAELAKAFRRIEDLVSRIEELGSRIEDLEIEQANPSPDDDHEAGLERPPHAAGPRD